MINPRGKMSTLSVWERARRKMAKRNR